MTTKGSSACVFAYFFTCNFAFNSACNTDQDFVKQKLSPLPTQIANNGSISSINFNKGSCIHILAVEGVDTCREKDPKDAYAENVLCRKKVEP